MVVGRWHKLFQALKLLRQILKPQINGNVLEQELEQILQGLSC